MRKTIYISGPITDPVTGQPREGWQKEFQEAEEKLREAGFDVINPINIARDLERDSGFLSVFDDFSINGTKNEYPRAAYVAECIMAMMFEYNRNNLHGVYVIGNDAMARQSVGVSMELLLASILGIPVYADDFDFADFTPDCGTAVQDGEIKELLDE